MDQALRQLTYLDSLRGFVAVGRRMSVTLAAEDLSLTQSALSRQVHGLEKALGLKLFHRGHRKLSFTPAGERLFNTAQSVLAQLAETIEAIAGRVDHRPVTLTASLGVTALWLLPRLRHFQQFSPRSLKDRLRQRRTRRTSRRVAHRSCAPWNQPLRAHGGSPA
jgi:LysR family transcriptional regulator, glycine cleavage system transcriptional activator